jgi:hypothetical protein
MKGETASGRFCQEDIRHGSTSLVESRERLADCPEMAMQEGK